MSKHRQGNKEAKKPKRPAALPIPAPPAAGAALWSFPAGQTPRKK